MRITAQVENILKLVPESRDNDKVLLKIYMQKYGLNLTDAQMDKLLSMPSFETITRCRRKLQEQGKYESSSTVREARFKRFKNVKAVAAQADADTLVEVLTESERLDRLGLRFADD